MPKVLYDEVKEDQAIEVSSQKPAVYSGQALSISGGNALPTSSFPINSLAPLVRKYKAGENLSANDAVYLAGGDGSLNSYYATMVRASSQYFSAADSASLSITGNLTIEAWVNIVSAPGAGAAFGIVSKWNSTGNQLSYYFSYIDSAGTKQLRFQNSVDGAAASTATTNYTLTTNTWTHLAAVYTAASSNVQFYVNGVAQGAAVGGLAASIFDSTAILEIGGNASNASEYIDGSEDDVRVWASARSAGQIAANYQIQLAGTETNLNAYWRLNNTLADETSNANTLTNNGGATFSTSNLPFIGGDIFRTQASVVGKFETFIGFAQAAAPTGGGVSITIAGEMGGFSSLSRGNQYYLSNSAGVISTTAGTNTRKVGIATSSTTLDITNIF